MQEISSDRKEILERVLDKELLEALLQLAENDEIAKSTLFFKDEADIPRRLCAALVLSNHMKNQQIKEIVQLTRSTMINKST